jgi:hypothetical protein
MTRFLAGMVVAFILQFLGAHYADRSERVVTIVKDPCAISEPYKARLLRCITF